jgi:hypothetical protein
MACLVYRGPTEEDVSSSPIEEFKPAKDPARKRAKRGEIIPNPIQPKDSKGASTARKKTSGRSQKQSQTASTTSSIEVHTPEQLGLDAKRILKDEFRDLLILCTNTNKLPEVRLLPVTFNGGNDVFTYVNVGNTPAGLPRGQRQLRRALTKREWDEAYGGREFDKGDSYAAVAVRCEGEVYALGPREDSVYVNVGEATS